MKIFQAYYKDDQIPHLDKEFTPFDNRANPVINFHEYYIYTQIYKEAQKTSENLWGHFSWQWKTKMPGIPANLITQLVKDNENFDVYTFHPYPNETVMYWNVWENGQYCHPYMIVLIDKIISEMGYSTDLVRFPMDRNNYLCANYFVGNKKFWDGLLEFLSTFVEVCENLPHQYKILLDHSAKYEPNMAFNYRGFICERLISTYFLINPELRIRHMEELYQYGLPEGRREILELKEVGILNNDKQKLEEYLQKRSHLLGGGHDWGRDWIDSCGF